MDLIDRQAVLDCLCACFEEVNYGDNDDAIALLGYAMHYVEQMPTVEPKRGECDSCSWHDACNWETLMKDWDIEHGYCAAYSGADMRGDSE